MAQRLDVPVREPETDDELQALIEEARRRARRRRVGYLALLVTAATLAGVLFLILGGRGEPQGLASNAPESEPTGIQYTRITGLTLAISGNYSFYQPRVYEAWVSPDGSGKLRTIERPAEWPGPRDKARAIKADDQDALDRTNAPPKVLQDEELSADQIDESWGGGSAPPARSLSSDPSELRGQLESWGSGAGPINVRAFQRAATVLMNPEADASVRAATFEAIGELRGVTIDKSATDPEGRGTTSASISYDYSGPPGSTMTVYFDPKSSRAFAFTDILDAPARFIDSRTLTSFVLTDAKTVSSIPN
jgi:hypothetical protein